MILRVGPAGPRPAHIEEEPLEELLPVRGVDHLGMKLHSEDSPLHVVQGGHG